MLKRIKNLFAKNKDDDSNDNSGTESDRDDLSSCDEVSENFDVITPEPLSTKDTDKILDGASSISVISESLSKTDHNQISNAQNSDIVTTKNNDIQLPSISAPHQIPSTSYASTQALSAVTSIFEQENGTSILPQFISKSNLSFDNDKTAYQQQPSFSRQVFSTTNCTINESAGTESTPSIAVEQLYNVSRVVANIPGIKIYDMAKLPLSTSNKRQIESTASINGPKTDALKISNESEWPSLGGGPSSSAGPQVNVKTGYSNKLKQPVQQPPKPNTWAAKINIAHQNNPQTLDVEKQQVVNKNTAATQKQTKKKKKSGNKKVQQQQTLKVSHEGNKKRRNNGLIEWVDEPEGNEDDAFERFEITLSVYNYYKSYGYKVENGLLFDPRNENIEPVISEFSSNINLYDSDSSFDGNYDDEDDDTKSQQQKPRKKFHVKDKDFEFPKIYQDLLFEARITKKVNYNLLNQSPYDEEILENLEKEFSNVHGAGEKLKIFNYLQLIQEILETDESVAHGATVTMEDAQSKKMRRLFIKNKQVQIQVVDGRRIKNVMVIKVPYQVDPNAENGKTNGMIEKITLMRQIYLIRDIDVANGVEDAKYYKVRIAMTFPSENNGPITLIAILDELEMKQLCGLSGNTFSIFLVPNIEAANAVLKSIDKIKKSPDLTSKVFPSPSAYPRDISSYTRQMARDLDSMFYDSPKPFNQKQKEAIYSMTRPVNTTFLLFGPPGTGKSYIIAETVRQLLDPEKQKTSTDRTILICTPSNMAADAIAEAIVDRNFLKPFEMFRLVSICREAFTRNEKLDAVTKRTMVMDTGDELICPIYDIPYADVIRNYKVIVCTLGSIPRLRNYIEPGHFSHIFIDEAAQAPEMDVWLAVGYLATNKTRILLAGDPKQLGPTTTVEVLYNKDYGFKTSLLSRLMEDNLFKNDPRYLIQLTDNHRSHQGIVRISSELFYENSLVSTNPAGHDSLCALPFLRKPNFPVLFHSVTSGGEETSETRSRRNLAEVDIIVQYVNKCLRHVKAKDIGVVSPYKYQAESIRQRLNNREITVETVEKYQGSERRVIIISTVRTSGNLGFMADDLRFNTAITRAKHLLIVVGKAASFRSQLSWKRFMDYCAHNNSFIDGFPDETRIANCFAQLQY